MLTFYETINSNTAGIYRYGNISNLAPIFSVAQTAPIQAAITFFADGSLKVTQTGGSGGVIQGTYANFGNVFGLYLSGLGGTFYFFKLGGLLNGSDTRQCGIKEVKEDEAEILVVMKSSWRMGILGRKMFKHRPERLKVFESFEGVLVDRIHGLKSPEISSLTDRERPL